MIKVVPIEHAAGTLFDIRVVGEPGGPNRGGDTFEPPADPNQTDSLSADAEENHGD